MLDRYKLKEGVDYTIHNNMVTCKDSKYLLILMLNFGDRVSGQPFEQ